MTGVEGEGYRDAAAPSERPEDQGHHGKKGGRPRKHTGARRAAADRAAAYRQRQKQTRIAANDVALESAVNEGAG